MDPWTLGIDVSKATLDVALLGEGTRRFHRFANSPAGQAQLVAWLQQLTDARPHACLEATGTYGEGVAQVLHAQGYPVSVVNPLRIKAYAASTLRRFKTDKGDAELIACFCQKERPALWTPPPESFRALQALVRHLEDLKGMRQQEHNRLQAGAGCPQVLANLTAHLAFLDAQIAQVVAAIRAHIDQHPDLKRQKDLLVSIPGIGPTTAALLLGEVRDLRAFASARQLAAYAGLVPEPRDSGTSVHRRPRLSKRGNARLRKALYLPAVVAKRHNPLLRALSERMAQTGHCPMAILGAIMRKLLHLAYGVIKTGRPFDPLYPHTAGGA
ncbi:MAG: IS110 family transposase [Anaerolineae bacterium]